MTSTFVKNLQRSTWFWNTLIFCFFSWISIAMQDECWLELSLNLSPSSDLGPWQEYQLFIWPTSSKRLPRPDLDDNHLSSGAVDGHCLLIDHWSAKFKGSMMMIPHVSTSRNRIVYRILSWPTPTQESCLLHKSHDNTPRSNYMMDEWIFE